MDLRDPDDAEEAAFDLLWSVRRQLPRRQVIVAEELPLEVSSGLRAEFRRSLWVVLPALSHVRVLYRGEDRTPTELRDSWAPAILLPPEVLAACDDERILCRLSDSKHQRPYRATEHLTLAAPSEDDRILLELDRGDPAFYVSRGYLTPDAVPLLIQEAWVSVETVLRYDRNLAWERVVAPNPREPEDPDPLAEGR